MGDGGKEQVVVALTKPERCYCMKRRRMLRLNENSHNIKIVFKIRLTVSKEMSQSFRTEVLKLWVTTHWWVVSRSWVGQHPSAAATGISTKAN
ncbi:hypothetical protein T4E_9819 [Trichinella pseudospiralis]|uniref:Uncharacterized protein n=1 Tax=Trichinella pseudospiralis TaxID=6337 RepID=A0A0V0Y794_TRIPS|nr:hypothetical protein T4E_9819 [Trichinella pseudospiralis]